jgi:hypothetical protein
MTPTFLDYHFPDGIPDNVAVLMDPSMTAMMAFKVGPNTPFVASVIAKMFGITKMAVHRARLKGKLKGYKDPLRPALAKEWLFRAEDVVKWRRNVPAWAQRPAPASPAVVGTVILRPDVTMDDLYAVGWPWPTKYRQSGLGPLVLPALDATPEQLALLYPLLDGDLLPLCMYSGDHRPTTQTLATLYNRPLDEIEASLQGWCTLHPVEDHSTKVAFPFGVAQWRRSLPKEHRRDITPQDPMPPDWQPLDLFFREGVTQADLLKLVGREFLRARQDVLSGLDWFPLEYPDHPDNQGK